VHGSRIVRRWDRGGRRGGHDGHDAEHEEGKVRRVAAAFAFSLTVRARQAEAQEKGRIGAADVDADVPSCRARAFGPRSAEKRLFASCPHAQTSACRPRRVCKLNSTGGDCYINRLDCGLDWLSKCCLCSLLASLRARRSSAQGPKRHCGRYTLQVFGNTACANDSIFCHRQLDWLAVL
jgi:hypothetical protein